jgi:hypothetical protein
VAAPGAVPGDEPVAQVAAEVEPSVVQVNVSGVERTPFGPRSRRGSEAASSTARTDT